MVAMDNKTFEINIPIWPVSALNGVGESTNSTQVSARPTSSASVAIGVTNLPSQLLFGWPTDHTGWELQSQTNNLTSGLGTNWINVSASAQTNWMTLPINAIGSVFFGLVRPY
jgi:hypothetical protein